MNIGKEELDEIFKQVSLRLRNRPRKDKRYIIKVPTKDTDWLYRLWLKP